MWDPLKSNFNWSQIMLEIKKSLSLNMLERREHCNRNWRNFATLVKILMSLVIFWELAYFGLGWTLCFWPKFRCYKRPKWRWYVAIWSNWKGGLSRPFSISCKYIVAKCVAKSSRSQQIHSIVWMDVKGTTKGSTLNWSISGLIPRSRKKFFVEEIKTGVTNELAYE